VSRCPAVKPNGEQCRLKIGPRYRFGTDGLCWWHSADAEAIAWRRDKSSQGGRAGGRQRRMRVTKPTQLETLDDALLWQSWIVEQLAGSQLDPKVAQQLSRAVEVWLRAQGYAERLRKLEKQAATFAKLTPPKGERHDG
jgi:hypothetical protein